MVRNRAFIDGRLLILISILTTLGATFFTMGATLLLSFKSAGQRAIIDDQG